MKKLLSIIFVLVCLFFISTSCEKEMINYKGVDGVYFQVQPKTLTEYGNPEYWPYSDSTDIAFGQMTADDTTMMVKIKLMGNLSSSDRVFGMKIGEGTTAEEGKDYDVLAKQFVIPANKEYVLIPITFHRTPELTDENKYLTLELVGTPELNIALNIWHSLGQQSVTDTVRVDIHTFILSDIYVKPNSWNDYQGGPFTYAKFQLLLELYDLEPTDFDKKNMGNTRFRAIMVALKMYLLEKEQEGNPIYETDRKGNIIYEKDEDGNLIKDKDGNSIPVKMSVGTV